MSNPNDIAKKTRESRKGNEPLSTEARAAIYASVVADEDKTVIAHRFNINLSTVYDIMKRYSERKDFKSRPRSGRPRSLNARGERYLVRLARRVPNASWRTLLQLSGNCVCERVARKILHRHHIRKCRPKRCPKLTPLRAKKRREFCRFWKGSELELASVSKP